MVLHVENVKSVNFDALDLEIIVLHIKIVNVLLCSIDVTTCFLIIQNWSYGSRGLTWRM